MSNLDEALERFALGDLEYAGGRANHGPMAAEALEVLGHPSLIPALLDVYAPRLPPAEVGSAMTRDEQTGALGRIERRADWVATFEAALGCADQPKTDPDEAFSGNAGDWQSVVIARLPSLLPGGFAAAGHGMLRTAHAIRALEAEDNRVRRRELARGLAHWAARFQALPAILGRADVGPSPLGPRLIELARSTPVEARAGLFTEAVRDLDVSPSFKEAIGAAPIARGYSEESAGAALGELCRAAARLFLANPESRIAFVHSLTIPSTARVLLPYLDDDSRAVLVGFCFQSIAAFSTLYGDSVEPQETDAEVEAAAKSWDEIRYRAACSIQEHAIKMTAACWTEDRTRPDPIFALAAADAALRLEGVQSSADC